VANQGRLVGESLILLRSVQRPPNSGAAWRYIVVILVMLIGSLYAAPNLFLPDPAIRIKGQTADQIVDESTLAEVTAALTTAGVKVLGSELITGAGLVRLEDPNQQQKARDAALALLNSDDTRYTVALDQASTVPEWLAGIGGQRMSLGLDLSGGVHFLLQVDMEQFIGLRLKSQAEGYRDLLVDKRVRYVAGEWVRNREIRIPFASEEARTAGRTVIEENNDGFALSDGTVEGNPGLILRFTDAKIEELQNFAIDQNLTSLRNRVNELGVAEPQVQRLGRERIVLDLPGMQDPARAKEIINKFANLEFRLAALPNDRPSQIESYEYEGLPTEVQLRNIVTGDDVINAIQDYDPETSQPQVSITLDADGGEKMHDVTKDHIGDRMAIIFIAQQPRERRIKQEDGTETVEFYSETKRRLINVATVQAALGFRFRITGLEFQEARDLALLLRAGSLAAPMYIVEERTIGASLGEENIDRGINAMIASLLLMAVFMAFKFKGFGLTTNVALVSNIILMTAIMSMLGATLTMPGIAGMVLTIGMAVDANILINTRIREEFKVRPPQQAIQAGFDRALITILDSNITTFFVGIILFSIGSGPVKGFAVVLCVGIVTSVFTAVLVGQALINFFYGGRDLTKVRV